MLVNGEFFIWQRLKEIARTTVSARTEDCAAWSEMKVSASVRMPSKERDVKESVVSIAEKNIVQLVLNFAELWACVLSIREL